MDVQDIVGKWLEENGYDGLYDPGVCACKLSDLMPCGNLCPSCEAGYLCKSNGECEADFHIGATRDEICDGCV